MRQSSAIHVNLRLATAAAIGTPSTHVAVLKAKSAHLSAMSSAHLSALREQGRELVSDVTAGLDEDPGSPTAQSLLDRWLSFLQALTGTPSVALSGGGAFQAAPELGAEVWARRMEWMPPASARDVSMPASADDARALARKLSESFASPEVLAFIKRARAARMG